jgi:hypothetical protein
MQRLGSRERLREMVIDAWSKIIGDFIAAHSTPVALREGASYMSAPGRRGADVTNVVS